MEERTRDVGSQLREHLRALREHALLMITCIALCASTAVTYTLTGPVTYSATAQVLLQQDDIADRVIGIGGGQQVDPEREVATAIELVEQPAIAVRTARAMRIRTSASDLLARISAESLGNSRLLAVTATDEDAAFAARLVNAYAREYVGFRRDTASASIERALAAVRTELATARRTNSAAQVADLSNRLSQLEVLESVVTGGAEVIQRASVPTAPSSTSPVRSGILGFLAGLVIAVALALLRERLDRRVKREEDLSALLPGVPLLATVPSWRLQTNGAQAIESFRSARTTLKLLDPDNAMQSILVTSATVGEGKTTASLNLALALAEGDDLVAVVDADLRRKGLSGRLGVQDRPGVANILRGDGDVRDYIFETTSPRDESSSQRSSLIGSRNAVASATTLTTTLDVVPAGDAGADPQVLLAAGERLRRMLSGLTARYEHVIVDGTPLGVLTDMLPVVTRVDAVVLVVHLYHTRRNELRRLSAQLSQAGVRPIGMIVFGNPVSDRAYLAYHGT